MLQSPRATRVLRGCRARPADARALVVRERPPAGEAEGTWALPKGLIDAGERPSDTALREGFEETGVQAELVTKLGDVRYVYTWDGERVFKVVSFFLAHAGGGRIGRAAARNGGRGRRGALAPTRRGRGPPRVQRRARDGREGS